MLTSVNISATQNINILLHLHILLIILVHFFWHFKWKFWSYLTHCTFNNYGQMIFVFKPLRKINRFSWITLKNIWQSICFYWLWWPRGENVSRWSEFTHINRADCVFFFFGTWIWCETNKHLDYEFDIWTREEATRTKHSQNGRGGTELLSAFCAFCICAGGSGEGCVWVCVCVCVRCLCLCPWVRKHRSPTAIQMGLFILPACRIHTQTYSTPFNAE